MKRSEDGDESVTIESSVEIRTRTIRLDCGAIWDDPSCEECAWCDFIPDPTRE